MKRHRCILLSLAGASLLLFGCAAQQQGQTLADFPTLAQLRPRVPRHYDLPNNAGFPQPEGAVVMQSLDVPLTANLSPMWKLINEHAFARSTRQFWHANGLRIGLIAASKLRKLQKTLPHVLASDRAELTGSAYPTPLIKSPVLDRSYTVHLPTNTGQTKTIHITGGRVQLLATVTRDGAGNLFLDLIPHHYVPSITVQPQQPLARQLDGKMFRRLTLETRMPQGAVLVIGLYQRPSTNFQNWKKAFHQLHPASQPSSHHAQPHQQTAPQSQPSRSAHSMSRRRKHLPYVPARLGRALMIDPTFGGAAQQLFFIGVHPLPGQSSSQSADANEPTPVNSN